MSFKNKRYKGVDLHNWFKNNRDKFSIKELEIMYRLIPSRKQNKAVKIIDANTTKTLNTYPSINEAGRALQEEFYVLDSVKQGASMISMRLLGKIKNPVYKGFIFQYAEPTEEPTTKSS